MGCPGPAVRPPHAVPWLAGWRGYNSGVTEWITPQHGAHKVTARQYWAAPIPPNTNGSGEVVIVDPANNRAVIVEFPPCAGHSVYAAV